jgi:hypothetical protein
MQEKANAQSKKATNKGKKSNKQPGTKPTARVPKKAHIKKHSVTYASGMGARTLRTIEKIVVSMTRMERSDFCATEKGGENPIPQGKIVCS